MSTVWVRGAAPLTQTVHIISLLGISHGDMISQNLQISNNRSNSALLDENIDLTIALLDITIRLTLEGGVGGE